MHDRYFYTDPTGHKSGPFTELELRELAARGVLSPDGILEIEGISRGFLVREFDGLAASVAAGAAPVGASHAIDGRGSAFDATRPPTEPPPEHLRGPPPRSKVARSTYILLALLPALVGVFGAHNVVAGHIARGVVQLVLSAFTIGGVLSGIVFPLCCCVGVPLYAGMYVWVIVEAIVVTRDARGLEFA
ncbi:MAG: DUF4339 domain-containing protein [Planctomycetaceae bacterium]|jgi:hypothetical protein|nr:DUF4339 domain-containing protein [Planctomycetaceae bacterium]